VEHSTEETEDRHLFFANRASALIELKRYEEALDDASKAIELDANYVKGYIRKAEAERELLKNEEALATLQKALELE